MSGSLALVTEMGEWSASTRTRALRHVTALEMRGWSVSVSTPNDRPPRGVGRVGQVRFFADHASRYVQRRADVRQLLATSDAAYVQRGAYPLGPDQVVRAFGDFDGPVVLDLDDAMFVEKPSIAAKGRAARWLYGSQQARFLLSRADHVLVSTAELASSLPSCRAPVEILPTVPDVSRYTRRNHGENIEAPTVGWVGTSGGLIYLDPLQHIVPPADGAASWHLVVVSDQKWSGPAKHVAWDLRDRYRYMSRFDIGIMPLPDTPYTRAKAGFKLLEYMAAGIPVVASPVGVNRELVNASGGGYLATTTEEWREAINALAADADLRATLGRSGRRYVEQFANHETQADVVAAALLTRRPT